MHWRSPGILFLRSALWTILLPGIVAGYVPWRYFGFRLTSVSGARGIIGLFVLLFGAVVLLWSIVEFARRGRGTLSPVDPPERLVVTGMYRYVRNPMYVGVMCVLTGEALISGQPGLIVYGVAFFVAANLFILGYEEPYLQRSFGSSYAEYRRNVRRWIPRSRPWIQSI